MKNSFKAFVFLPFVVFSVSQSKAQTTHKDSSLGHKIGVTATKVGHKTSEIAANGESAVVDKKYKGKYGPGGQTVYINKYSHYYYISKKGHRIYLKKSQLTDKPSS
jgi:hypothetical protein